MAIRPTGGGVWGCPGTPGQLDPPSVGVTGVERALRDLARALESLERRFALVGGLAVSARAEPRFTRDVDVAVAVKDDADGEALVHGMLGLGYSVMAALEQDATNRLATVRMISSASGPRGVVTDLLFASSGIEGEVVGASDPIELVPGVVVPIASVGHLIALKTLSHRPERPQDLMDLNALFAVANPTDWRVAREALRLIEARGFNRGKHLLKELDGLTPGPR